MKDIEAGKTVYHFERSKTSLACDLDSREVLDRGLGVAIGNDILEKASKRGLVITVAIHRPEKIVEVLSKVSCSYDGCDFESAITDDVRKHEQDECQKRKVPCGHCKENIPLEKIADHVTHMHNGGSKITISKLSKTFQVSFSDM